MNTGTLSGFGRKRLSAVADRGRSLRGDGGTSLSVEAATVTAYPDSTPSGAAGTAWKQDGLLEGRLRFATGTISTFPVDTGTLAAVAWHGSASGFTRDTPGVGGSPVKLSLAARPSSFIEGPIPGWEKDLTDIVASAAPIEAYNVQNFGSSVIGPLTAGSAWGVGTSDSMSGNGSGSANMGGLAFFSMGAKIDALPSSGEYLYLGQFYPTAAYGGVPFGVGARIDSAGAFSIIATDPYAGGGGMIAAGGTGVVAGSQFYIQRFGRSFKAWRAASGATTTAISPIEGMLAEGNISVYGFATLFAKCAFGYCGYGGTGTARVSFVRVAG